MHNIKLTIAYDGSDFLGWQATRMGPSIEETLQRVIEKIIQHPAPLQACSRTDAGVHANGQVINFLTSKQNLDLHRFHASLNSLLPKAIVVLDVKEMPASFHPTLDCTGKEYRYFICTGPTQFPCRRHFSWHVPIPLDLRAIGQALPHFIGTHDFAAFCNFKKNAHYADTIRTVQSLSLAELPENQISFHISGNHFLYKMVRNIVGTLIDIGRGKIEGVNIPAILNSLDRTQAGVTAPAHGLFLQTVFY